MLLFVYLFAHLTVTAYLLSLINDGHRLWWWLALRAGIRMPSTHRFSDL